MRRARLIFICTIIWQKSSPVAVEVWVLEQWGAIDGSTGISIYGSYISSKLFTGSSSRARPRSSGSSLVWQSSYGVFWQRSHSSREDQIIANLSKVYQSTCPVQKSWCNRQVQTPLAAPLLSCALPQHFQSGRLCQVIYILCWCGVCLCVTFCRPPTCSLFFLQLFPCFQLFPDFSSTFHNSRMVFHGSRSVFMAFQESRLVFMIPGWFFMVQGQFSWFFIPSWFIMVPG